MFKHILLALVAIFAFAGVAEAQPTYVTPDVRVQGFTADGEVGDAEVVHNSGASAAVVLQLPSCDLSNVGVRVFAYVRAAQDIDLNPYDADTILDETNAAGDAISSAATLGNYIELVCISANSWLPMATSGTWTDVN